MSIYQTYILYYFIILSTSLIVFISERLGRSKFNKISKLFFWIAILMPIIVSSFRYGIGVDYYNYERIYYLLTNNNGVIDNIINTRYEPGWILLNHFVKYLFDDVKYVFIISSLLIWILNFKSIQNFKGQVSVSVAILILLTTMYNPSFNIIRLSVAASIIMLSVKPILDRNFWKFLIIIVFAGSFHYTSLIFFPAYWLINSKTKNVSLVKKAIAVMTAFLLLILAKPITSFITSFEIFSGYSHYQLNYDNFSVGMTILKLPIIVMILFNLKKLKKSQNSIFQIIIFYFIGAILQYFSYLEEYVGRIAIYFEMMQIFIVAAIIKVQQNKYEKLLYTFIVVLYFLGLYTFEIIVKNGHKTIPYIWHP